MTARRGGGLVAEVERTLKAYRDRLRDEDAAEVALVRRLAKQLDEDEATAQNGAVWREFRAALATLRMIVEGASDDDTAAFLVTVQTPTKARGRTAVRDASES